jgi:exopolysaccharide biosynthesis WecB/TagA/CpsF family protein
MQAMMPEEEVPTVRTKQVLGIKFFDGNVEEAVAHAARHRGLVVAPAAPSMIALQHDEAYRRAIADADLAIADSGWMVVFWRLLRRERLHRISGLIYFKRLLERAECREPGKLFWILPNDRAKSKTLDWSRRSGFPTTVDDCYIAPRYETPPEDETLLDLVRKRKPAHIVVGIGGGMQDKIGSYLKHQCGYHPAIHCIGAAPGFVTGDQIRIPMWADRFFLGWLFRLFAQPRVFIPRFWSARKLPWLILRYGRDLPRFKVR